MLQSLTLLVTSAGRRVELLACFREDAARLGLALRIVAADARPDLSPACHIADKSVAVPRCSEASYTQALLETCARERVSLVVPTIDPELQVLSRDQDRFKALGARVVISSLQVVQLAGDKLATANRLAAVSVPAPRAMDLTEYQRNPSALHWPVIAKPKSGSASQGVLRPSTPDELMGLRLNDYVVQELLPGREYTVNVFFDRDGRLRCAIPHHRIEVRGGEVSKGRTERIAGLEEAARRIATALPGACGPLCFQAVVAPDGSYGVFEINARFGGGYPLAHRAGARFSQLLLEEASGATQSANDQWHAGVTMLRYDQSVFLDG
jgi:carbamoyl-phosphate synthase large subunit